MSDYKDLCGCWYNCQRSDFEHLLADKRLCNMISFNKTYLDAFGSCEDKSGQTVANFTQDFLQPLVPLDGIFYGESDIGCDPKSGFMIDLDQALEIKNHKLCKLAKGTR